MRSIWVTLGLLFLIALEILKVYFIMPFPGSQRSDSIDTAYFIHNNIWWLRALGVLIVILPVMHFFRRGKLWQKLLLTIGILFYLFVAYMFNFRFLADKMFLQPNQVQFSPAATDTTNKNKLVIAAVINGEAKAYPIDIIGYHHQVVDKIGGQDAIVTYCTVCRTGRVFSPMVDGKQEHFRLVGMDHFNAMFEDASTKSWWRQVTGEAIAGPLKGKQLDELPSTQMRLGDWIALHPDTKVLQPDTIFRRQYAGLKGFDEGTIESNLEGRDSGSWKFKSWVIGVSIGGKARAWDWNELQTKKLIQDSLAGTPLLITLEPNGQTFYVLNRKAATGILHFTISSDGIITDTETNSVWKPNGSCIEGVSKGSSLQPVQAYQEFWHSWQQFHPNTTADKR
jgi:hypothetical protein